ncbi:MAG: hypothetical protein ACR2JB_14735 [Bryobacteraceae bacterium]
MTKGQAYLAMGVPSLINVGLITFLYLALSRQVDALKDLWRAELHRFEEVLDVRLKHVEDALGKR